MYVTFCVFSFCSMLNHLCYYWCGFNVWKQISVTFSCLSQTFGIMNISVMVLLVLLACFGSFKFCFNDSFELWINVWYCFGIIMCDM